MEFIIKKKKKKIKIISYNIKSCQECNLSMIIDYLKRKNADVICLQEVDKCSKYCKENICQEINQKLNLYTKYLKTINRKGYGEYGIFIASKYPIDEYEEYYYKKYNEKRGIQRIKIFIPLLNKHLNIFNTHLDYKHPRDSQVIEIIEILNKYDDSILCGDLNLNPTEEIYNNISSKFKQINYSNTYSTKRPKQILDYILLSKEIPFSHSYFVEDIYLSDHKPLICNIKKN